MKDILVYQPPGSPAQVVSFIEGLEPRLRRNCCGRSSPCPVCPLREPHYKHFGLERYRSFYEVRAKSSVAVRIIFAILPDKKILLLHGFSKRQSRDTMRALEQSLRILAAFRDDPEHAVEYKIKEEETK